VKVGANIFPTSVDALTKSMTFLEERHRLILDNIANVGTPGYKAKSAPIAEFQRALAKAIEERQANRSKPLALESTAHFRETRNGMAVTPSTAPEGDSGILKHDGNNVSLEKEMSDLAQNTLMHRVMSELLRSRFAGLKSAIAERVE
jgi:flagellar basal-body rod protein FlgB